MVVIVSGGGGGGAGRSEGKRAGPRSSAYPLGRRSFVCSFDVLCTPPGSLCVGCVCVWVLAALLCAAVIRAVISEFVVFGFLPRSLFRFNWGKS
jgi:hypothetical protein